MPFCPSFSIPRCVTRDARDAGDVVIIIRINGYYLNLLGIIWDYLISRLYQFYEQGNAGFAEQPWSK